MNVNNCELAGPIPRTPAHLRFQVGVGALPRRTPLWVPPSSTLHKPQIGIPFRFSQTVDLDINLPHLPTCSLLQNHRIWNRTKDESIHEAAEARSTNMHAYITTSKAAAHRIQKPSSCPSKNLTAASGLALTLTLSAERP